MATLYSSIPTSKRPTLATHQRAGYLTDGWSAPQVWDGQAATSASAGIVGPSREVGAWAPTPGSASPGSEPGVTVGVHLVRYRYKNSKTGYVSDPSSVYTFTLALATFAWDFTFTAGSGQADTTVLEATLAGGVTFFVAAEAATATGTVRWNRSDRQLSEYRLPWPDDGHVVPPVTAHAFSYRGRMWYYGQVVHSTGIVTVANGSTSVTGTGTGWLAGTSPTSDYQRNRRRIRFGTETTSYEIASNASATALTLATAKSGAVTDGTYTIYSLDAQLVWFSHPGFPEGVPLLNFLTGPGLETVRAAIGVLNGVLICGLSTMHYLRYTDDPGVDGSMRQVAADRGSVSHHVTVNADDTVYTLDRKGVVSWGGGAPDALSSPIESVIDRINFAVESTFNACYYPDAGEIRWFVALDADTTPMHYLAWNMLRRSWSMGSLEVACRASTFLATASSAMAVTGDANGHVWLEEQGTTGGSDANPVGTVAAGATTTVVPFSDLAALPTAGVGLDGVTAHFVRLNETRVVSANTASEITVSAAFSSAPVVGDVIQLGRIKALFKTKAFTFDGSARNKHTGNYVTLWFKPLTERRYVRVRIYRDWSTTPLRFSRAQYRRDAQPPRGMLYPDPDDAIGGSATGGSDWRVDVSLADGVVRIPLGDTSVRVTEVEVEVTEADCRVEILAVTVDAEPIASLV